MATFLRFVYHWLLAPYDVPRFAVLLVVALATMLVLRVRARLDAEPACQCRCPHAAAPQPEEAAAVEPEPAQPPRRRVHAAAIRDADGRVWSLPAPARHHQVIAHIRENRAPYTHDPAAQGFVDDTGAFLSRVEAAHVALASGQVTGLTAPPRLYTEDLW